MDSYETYLTSECFDLSNLRNVKELLPVQSEDQQAEHSDVLQSFLARYESPLS